MLSEQIQADHQNRDSEQNQRKQLRKEVRAKKLIVQLLSKWIWGRNGTVSQEAKGQ
jgi:hypothetical protein